jgi:hypothetical protein
MTPTIYGTPSQQQRQGLSTSFAVNNGCAELVGSPAAAKEHSNRARSQMSLLQVFVFLQLLDFLTTILVLKHGGYEANPFVSQLMLLGPVNGLFVAKVLVVGIGAAIMWFQRNRVVFIANYIYALTLRYSLPEGRRPCRYIPTCPRLT